MSVVKSTRLRKRERWWSFSSGGGGYVYDNTKLHNGGAVAARVEERGPKVKRASAVCIFFFFFFYTHDRIFNNNLLCPLTFTRESLQLVRRAGLPPVFDHSFYFLESLRIATNRSIDRAKFVLPWNLCPAVVRADGASPFHAFRFLFYSIEPRFQVTHLLSISRSSRSVLWVYIIPR